MRHDVPPTAARLSVALLTLVLACPSFAQSLHSPDDRADVPPFAAARTEIVYAAEPRVPY